MTTPKYIPSPAARTAIASGVEKIVEALETRSPEFTVNAPGAGEWPGLYFKGNRIAALTYLLNNAHSLAADHARKMVTRAAAAILKDKNEKSVVKLIERFFQAGCLGEQYADPEKEKARNALEKAALACNFFADPVLSRSPGACRIAAQAFGQFSSMRPDVFPSPDLFATQNFSDQPAAVVDILLYIGQQDGVSPEMKLKMACTAQQFLSQAPINDEEKKTKGAYVNNLWGDGYNALPADSSYESLGYICAKIKAVNDTVEACGSEAPLGKHALIVFSTSLSRALPIEVRLAQMFVEQKIELKPAVLSVLKIRGGEVKGTAIPKTPSTGL